jgi:hypothetical protein
VWRNYRLKVLSDNGEMIRLCIDKILKCMERKYRPRVVGGNGEMIRSELQKCVLIKS